MSAPFDILKPSYDPAEGVALFPYALGDLRFTEVLEFPKGADADAAASDDNIDKKKSRCFTAPPNSPDIPRSIFRLASGPGKT